MKQWQIATWSNNNWTAMKWTWKRLNNDRTTKQDESQIMWIHKPCGFTKLAALPIWQTVHWQQFQFCIIPSPFMGDHEEKMMLLSEWQNADQNGNHANSDAMLIKTVQRACVAEINSIGGASPNQVKISAVIHRVVKSSITKVFPFLLFITFHVC